MSRGAEKAQIENVVRRQVAVDGPKAFLQLDDGFDPGPAHFAVEMVMGELAFRGEGSTVIRFRTLVSAVDIAAAVSTAQPEAPMNRVQAFRRAFDATMKDPAFLADARKRKMDLAPMTGEQLTRQIAELFKAPAPIIAKAR